jgi:hypothetical protein
MRGIISKAQGPKLEDIIKLLCRRERTCRVELVSRRGTVRGEVTLKDGTILNAGTENAQGSEALGQMMNAEQLNFHSSAEIHESRDDWPEQNDPDWIFRDVGLRVRERQVENAEASRRLRRFALEEDALTGDLTPEEAQPVKEELGFLEFYGKEISDTLNLGNLLTLGYREENRSLVARRVGETWVGGVRSGSVQLVRLLDEESGA